MIFFFYNSSGYDVVPYPLTDFCNIEDRLKLTDDNKMATSPTPTIAESVVTDSTGQTGKTASSTPTIAKSVVTDSTGQTGKTKWLPHSH